MTIRSQTVYIVECDADARVESHSKEFRASSMAMVNQHLLGAGWYVSSGGETHRCPLHRSKSTADRRSRSTT